MVQKGIDFARSLILAHVSEKPSLYPSQKGGRLLKNGDFLFPALPKTGRGTPKAVAMSLISTRWNSQTMEFINDGFGIINSP
jgi:hypothetical protein